MNNIKQIREQFDLITEKEEKEDRKLSALVRAGLYDAKKLPALKKALEKSADKMSSQEKRMLLNLLDSLISQVVSDDQVYRKVRQNVHSMNEAREDYLSKFDPRFKSGYPSDRDIPSVLILKRKAIRVYPDNQKVALYYSQALDKYVTIPFSDIQTGINEEAKSKKETPEERKRRIAAALAGGSKTGKMLRTGKVLPSQKSLRTRISAAVKDITDVSQRSGKAIAAGVTTGNIIKGGLKAAYNAIRVKRTEKKLQDRLARRKENKLVARRKEVKDLTKDKRQETKAASRRKEVRDLTKAKRQEVKTKETKAASRRKEVSDLTKAKRQETKAATPTIPTLKRRSPEATAKKMAANPNVDYSTAARKEAAKANVTEMFNRRLSLLREERNLQEGKVSDFTYGDLDDVSLSSIGKDLTPGIGTARAAERTKRAWKKGSYGSAALNAADTALSGASDAALAIPVLGTVASGIIKGGLGAVKGLRAGYRAYNAYKKVKAAKTVNKADKVADVTKTVNKADNVTDVAKTASKADKVADVTKTASKTKPKGKFSTARNLPRKVLRLTGKAARLGVKGAALAAGAAGAAGGNDNSHILSKGANPQFGKSALFKSDSGFSNTTDAETATRERARQAQVKALTTEQDNPYVLSKGADPKFGLKPRTSGSKRRFNPNAARDERIRQRQLSALTTTNESVIDTIKNMVANNIQEANLSFNEQEITINNTVAKKLLNVYESVNKTNKKKMEQMLNENATSFNKVLMFAVRQ